jgi:hypothetical protein
MSLKKILKSAFLLIAMPSLSFGQYTPTSTPQISYPLVGTSALHLDESATKYISNFARASEMPALSGQTVQLA